MRRTWRCELRCELLWVPRWSDNVWSTITKHWSAFQLCHQSSSSSASLIHSIGIVVIIIVIILIIITFITCSAAQLHIDSRTNPVTSGASAALALEPCFNNVEGGTEITSIDPLLRYVYYCHLLQYMCKRVRSGKHGNKKRLCGQRSCSATHAMKFE